MDQGATIEPHPNQVLPYFVFYIKFSILMCVCVCVYVCVFYFFQNMREKKTKIINKFETQIFNKKKQTNKQTQLTTHNSQPPKKTRIPLIWSVFEQWDESIKEESLGLGSIIIAIPPKISKQDSVGSEAMYDESYESKVENETTPGDESDTTPGKTNSTLMPIKEKNENSETNVENDNVPVEPTKHLKYKQKRDEKKTPNHKKVIRLKYETPQKETINQNKPKSVIKTTRQLYFYCFVCCYFLFCCHFSFLSKQ